MRIVLSEYVRTLKERSELDQLLPVLLLAMGIRPLAKTQQGTRQLGVDLSAVGIDPRDHREKLFLFVIKKGDIGRQDWDGTPQSIRPTLNEIFDVFLKNNVAVQFRPLPKLVVLVTSGDMKEELLLNWNGYIADKSNVADFEFWGADQLASQIEQHLLNEHVFGPLDRQDLRRALSLAGEVNYSRDSLHLVYLRQLGLQEDGEADIPSSDSNALSRSLVVVNLTSNIFDHWAVLQGNTKPAVLATERAVLWSWHRIRQSPASLKSRKVVAAFREIWRTYQQSMRTFVEIMRPHYFVKDGLGRDFSENALFSLVLFEHIGMLAAYGLTLLGVKAPDGQENIVDSVAEALSALISNNPSSGSPRLDEQVIDINLALLFLCRSGRVNNAQVWLEQLVIRVTFAYRGKNYYPADSIDDLFESEDEVTGQGFSRMSWLLPTLADWCIFLNRGDLFGHLAIMAQKDYPDVCQQLWHPNADLHRVLYFCNALRANGASEAPIMIPTNVGQYKKRIKKLLEKQPVEVPILESKRFYGDIQYIAYRHFRTLVPPFILYTEFSQQMIRDNYFDTGGQLLLSC